MQILFICLINVTFVTEALQLHTSLRIIMNENSTPSRQDIAIVTVIRKTITAKQRRLSCEGITTIPTVGSRLVDSSYVALKI